MKDKLREEQVALEKAREQILQLESQSQPLESDSELQQKLEQAEKARREVEIRGRKGRRQIQRNGGSITVGKNRGRQMLRGKR